MLRTSDFLFVIGEKSVSAISQEDPIDHVFRYRENLYVYLNTGGLRRFENGELLPLPGGHIFTHNQPVGVVEWDNEHYVLTQKEGLVHIQLNKFGFEIRCRKKESPLDDYLKSKRILQCEQVGPHTYGLSVEENGLVIVENWNRISAKINHSNGLQDESINGMYKGLDGSLWLALQNGISRIALDYPVRKYDARNGLAGIVEALTIHNNQLFAATNDGIFTKGASNDQFELIAPLTSWDITSVDVSSESKLLVATNNEIQEINKDGSLSVIAECYPWSLKASRFDQNTVYIGLDPGVFAIRWNGSKWISSQENRFIDQQINNITEDADGNLWYGTRSEHLFSGPALKWYGDSVDFGEVINLFDGQDFLGDPVRTVFFQNELLIGSVKGIRNPKLDLEIDSSFQLKRKDGYIHRLHTHKLNNQLWASVYSENDIWEVGFFDSKKTWNYKFFNPLAQDIIHCYQEEGKNKMWLGSPTGVYEVALNSTFSISESYRTIIRRIVVNGDSIIHYGNWQDSLGKFTTTQPISSIPEFHYETDEISFEFGALSFGKGDNMTYSYWLEGDDESWSKWSPEHKKEYTNLPPGEYVFKVKAKNIFETESEIAEYRFVINKPWFETTWYYAGQTGFFLALVLLTFFLSRSGRSDNLASVIAFITIITVFEYLIMTIEPIFQEYTGEIPIFNLFMNVLLAMSLVPLEIFIKKALAKRRKNDKV